MSLDMKSDLFNTFDKRTKFIQNRYLNSVKRKQFFARVANRVTRVKWFYDQWMALCVKEGVGSKNNFAQKI